MSDTAGAPLAHLSSSAAVGQDSFLCAIIFIISHIWASLLCLRLSLVSRELTCSNTGRYQGCGGKSQTLGHGSWWTNVAALHTQLGGFQVCFTAFLSDSPSGYLGEAETSPWMAFLPSLSHFPTSILLFFRTIFQVKAGFANWGVLDPEGFVAKGK